MTPAEMAAKRNLVKDLNSKKSGLMKRPLRVKFGRKIDKKNTMVNCYMFAEFESEASIANVISLVGKGKLLSGVKAYKAGTNTYVQIRRSRRIN